MPETEKQKFDHALEQSFRSTDMVFTGHVANPDEYIENAIKSIRESKCAPYSVNAVICEPGFEGKEIGDTVQGYCVAKRKGYWLVYQPEERIFYCFWGASEESLAAHGVRGGALECWLS